MTKPAAYTKIQEVVEALAMDGFLEVRPKLVRAHWDAVFPGGNPPSVQTIGAQFKRMENDGLLRKTNSGWEIVDAPKVPVTPPAKEAVDRSSSSEGWLDIVPKNAAPGQVDYVVAVRNALHHKAPGVIIRINPDKAPNFKTVRVRFNPELGALRLEEDPAGFSINKKEKVWQFRVAGEQGVQLAKMLQHIKGGPKPGDTAKLHVINEKTGRALEVQFV